MEKQTDKMVSDIAERCSDLFKFTKVGSERNAV